ncbi:MAG TPA: carbon-nitrogen family hydrolase [Ilumatobacteraceae bacterium]|nr:carbon-nitrogen family hydrolase [Ilumatobacteraceae bacterium]
MRVAAIQHDIVWTDRQANFQRLAPMIASAADSGARLVVLSETFSTGFAVEDPHLAEPEGGPSAQFLIDQAAGHRIWVAGTCPEIPAADANGSDTRPANTFVVAGPDGTTHRYQKIHPFTYGGEGKHFRPGSETVTIEIDGVRISLFVCYDLRFADSFWNVALDTDLYLVPANWPDSRRHHWMSLLMARAIENQAYVIGCNRVGGPTPAGLTYVGDSRIIDPLGQVLAASGDDEGILLADIDPQRVAEVRATFPFLNDR